MRFFFCLLLILLGAAVPSCLLFASAVMNDPVSGCKDDENFRFLNSLGKKKKCIWISTNEKRRNNYCHQHTIGTHCPFSCGLCTIDSTIKSINYTHKPSFNVVTPCKDSDNFQWKNNEKKNCNWIGNHSDRREKLCQNEIVSQACPQTCRICCADDESFRFTTTSTGSRKKCRWLALNPWRQSQFCNTIYKGDLIETKCPSSCGICTNTNIMKEDNPMPSVSPTNSGNGDPEEEEDANGHTIMTPTSFPTESPSNPTTPSPSMTPTNMGHTEDVGSQCKVDITLFTSFDYLAVKNRASGEICSSSSQFCDFLSNYTHDIVTIHNASSNTFDVRIVAEEDGVTAGNLTLDINGVTRIQESWNDNEEIPVLRMVCSKDCSCSFMKLFF